MKAIAAKTHPRRNVLLPLMTCSLIALTVPHICFASANANNVTQ